MIVVVGHPQVARDGASFRPAGTASLVALTAAARGAGVQLLGRVGDDDPGDVLLVRLAQAGVGHVALLRDAARRTPQLAHSTAEDGFEDPDPAAGPPMALDPADSSARPALDPGDVDLGLRYISDFRVLVLAEPLAAEIVRVAVDSARYSGAELVIVVANGGSAPEGVPPGALVLEAPETDREGSFATLLGELAAAIDAGTAPAAALDEVAARLGAVRPGAG